MFEQQPRRTVPRPDIWADWAFSENFDPWNLKAALVHILACVDGRLALLPRKAIDAGLRISRILDVWCADTATADVIEPATFGEDCRMILDFLEDPFFGRMGPTTLHRFARGLLDRLFPADHDTVFAGSGYEADGTVYRM